MEEIKINSFHCTSNLLFKKKMVNKIIDILGNGLGDV